MNYWPLWRTSQIEREWLPISTWRQFYRLWFITHSGFVLPTTHAEDGKRLSSIWLGLYSNVLANWSSVNKSIDHAFSQLYGSNSLYSDHRSKWPHLIMKIWMYMYQVSVPDYHIWWLERWVVSDWKILQTDLKLAGWNLKKALLN